MGRGVYELSSSFEFEFGNGISQRCQAEYSQNSSHK
jgi:hypothetical protein